MSRRLQADFPKLISSKLVFAKIKLRANTQAEAIMKVMEFVLKYDFKELGIFEKSQQDWIRAKPVQRISINCPDEFLEKFDDYRIHFNLGRNSEFFYSCLQHGLELFIKESSDIETKNNSSPDANGSGFQETILRYETIIDSHPDKLNVSAIAIAMARLVENEIEKMLVQRPNSEEEKLKLQCQFDLMELFYNGLIKIAEHLIAIEANPGNGRSKRAARDIISLSKALNKWWEVNDQKLVNFCIGTPAALGAFGVMRMLGAEPYIQAVATGATASYWLGSGVLKSAVEIIKTKK